MTLVKKISLLAALTLGAASPALAHHSFAMFDNTKEVVIKGTIKEFQWTNPHIWIQINVPNARGRVEEWSIEGSSPNSLGRRGWKRTVFTPGQAVTLKIHPFKNPREKGGSFMSATFADGRILTADGPPRPAT